MPPLPSLVHSWAPSPCQDSNFPTSAAPPSSQPLPSPTSCHTHQLSLLPGFLLPSTPFHPIFPSHRYPGRTLQKVPLLLKAMLTTPVCDLYTPAFTPSTPPLLSPPTQPPYHSPHSTVAALTLSVSPASFSLSLPEGFPSNATSQQGLPWPLYLKLQLYPTTLYFFPALFFFTTSSPHDTLYNLMFYMLASPRKQ